ncbi:MAG: ABC transporter permease [Dorea sp.]|jgi:putative ABC transport system permease protein|nr:ABC transporter permease [Dorea sp.]
MIGKLAFRNVRRSARDYLVYFLTMTFVTALMFAFNSLIFTKDIEEMFEVAGLMMALIGLATFFIVLIVAWLINYMVRFMLEKRSREFGIYLLIGMKKKEIARLYQRENMLLGTCAFLMGMVLGVLLQQIILAILYSMIRIKYDLHMEFNQNCILMTAGCYAGCYLLALFRCGRRFKKMNIRDLMEAQKKNEEVRESHEQLKKWLFPVSVGFLALFAAFIFLGGIKGGGQLLFFLVGLVLVIYLFYVGLSAWIVCYVRKRGNAVYRGQNLFLLRQFSSKLKTMSFTMGTLTALFTIAFLGCTVSMMFSDYQNKLLDVKFPFDVQINSGDVEDDFADEIQLIGEEAKILEAFSYHIYANVPEDVLTNMQDSISAGQTDGRNEERRSAGADGYARQPNQVNIWLSTNLKSFGKTYLQEDGSPDIEKIRKDSGGVYCYYDTYMKLSDYNHLRRMLGYSEVLIEDNEYLIHLKERIKNEVDTLSEDIVIEGSRGELKFAGYYTEPFSQDGHNGGDYVVVIPDSQARLLVPYYSEMALDIEGEAPIGLGNLLDDLNSLEKEEEEEGEDTEEERDFAGHRPMRGNTCCGSDTIIVMSPENMVRDNLIPETRYLLSTLIFPCFYVGLVFLCVALTVLSVQQLSDSAKYKFRYSVLRKLGMSRQEIDIVIWKQLVCYYLCPVLLAVVIGGSISVFMSGKFIFYTGIHSVVFYYFFLSFLLFFGIYLLYFITTYVSFRRNTGAEE